MTFSSLPLDSYFVQAKNLKTGARFTYVGAFVHYHVLTDPEPDPSYPEKVIFRAVRHSTSQASVYLRIRLDADQEVEVTS